MHKFPDEPARRQVWIDFALRDSSRQWTPAKRSVICSLHFAPNCYRAGNQRYLADFGLLTKKKYLEPDAVPTLYYAASAKHRDGSPAAEPTCKRRCCEEYLGTARSRESPCEPRGVEKTAQFARTDLPFAFASDSAIAVHLEVPKEQCHKQDAQPQSLVQLASKASQASVMPKIKSISVQNVQVTAEAGCQTDVVISNIEMLEATHQRVSTSIRLSDSEEELPSFRDDSADRT